MKQLLLTAIGMLTGMTAQATNVTPEQALLRATHFVKEHQLAADGQRRAAATDPAEAEPQLKAAGQVGGLYLFNIGDGEGYVIVSPDDRTQTVLGYSDSGSIDPDDMPEAMRVWLQGYADEIASLQANGTPAEVDPQAEARRASRTNISPLVATHYDQRAPYNNLCPTSGGSATLTGCVATAMAQVMYRYQYPTATTRTIPAYSTSTLGLKQAAVPAGTAVNWSNILPAYGSYHNGTSWQQSTYTSTQATAIANLMVTAGRSVKMNYTPTSSGGRSELIATALVRYFGFEQQTVQRLLRSYYTDTQWTDILYHELSNGRPVIYAGLAKLNSGYAAHAFVMDGYQTGDYFHINWGWGTTSNCNGYYLLSTMNPANTSYSTNGFTLSQDAVIGLQPAGRGGTVSAQVAKGAQYNIRMVDIHFSQNPVKPGSQVDIIATMQNNSVSSYTNGFIFIPWGSSSYSPSKDGVAAQLAPGETKVVKKTITAPSTEGEITYVIGYYNGSSFYINEGYTTEPLVVSNSASGISTVTAESPQQTDNGYYLLDGRRVEQPAKGLYIHHGRKVVVRP